MQHRHGTPFEHGSLTFFVRAPIFVWREWHRHRIGHSYNEESARYKKLDPVFYLPPRYRPLVKVEDWKPGRPKFLTLDEHVLATRPGWTAEDSRMVSEVRYRDICDRLKAVYSLAYRAYEQNLAEGLDPGLARACLPVGIYSSCWVTVNPRSLMAFLSLRTNEQSATFVSYPLYEMEVAARAVEEIFKAGWPLTHHAFNQCGRVGP